MCFVIKSCLIWSLTFSTAFASLEFLSSTQIDQGGCHLVGKKGIGECCCYSSTCGSWGDPCGGDLTLPLCQSNEVIHPSQSGNGYFDGSMPVNQGDICYAPGGCSTQVWHYEYTCCTCPYKYQVYATSSCDTGNMCVGCNNMPYEVLNGSVAKGFSCVENTKPCPGLSTMSDPKLQGAQVIVDPTFQSYVNGLIACAKSNLGAKGALNVKSSSRCAQSKGLTPAVVSDHQIGRALDTDLVLNDTSACNRDCMAQGYCAYNKAAASCSNIAVTQSAAKNKQINDFLTCAGKISGLEVGARYTPAGDWNHFEQGSPSAEKVNAYQLQLKAFCQQKPGCPGVKKVNPTQDACSCYP